MGELIAISGNKTAAIAGKLGRPEVVGVYPITPVTSVSEHLSKMVADGELDAELVAPESEHSLMNIIMGAAVIGVRTFLATCGQGLAYMCEPYIQMSTRRLPTVMPVANRDMISPTTGFCGQQDTMTMREAGWIQIYVEDNQEILDTILMAFKIGEHLDVRLPVNVCYDGFYVSHLVTGVDVPTQQEVDAFLPPFKALVTLDPEDPCSIDTVIPGPLFMKYRHSHLAAMEAAARVIGEVDAEFRNLFGRGYGGLVDTYRAEDAEVLMLTAGGVTGTARVAIDQARDRGERVGLIKLRSMRPFPRRELGRLLANRKAVGVIDRSVCFGWSAGPLYVETLGAISSTADRPKMLNFIDGLGGADITLEHIDWAISRTLDGARGKDVPEVSWPAFAEEELGENQGTAKAYVSGSAVE